ncbi:hypothetical protein, partial [Azohydromonas australica]|uniref:hypothetical protein n=1 Tax=Azohydromonas australica TaxID=364039 RepID=UPI001B7F7E1F
NAHAYRLYVFKELRLLVQTALQQPASRFAVSFSEELNSACLLKPCQLLGYFSASRRRVCRLRSKLHANSMRGFWIQPHKYSPSGRHSMKDRPAPISSRGSKTHFLVALLAWLAWLPDSA